jgi:DNA invertase Pin-like site-specific DNA recombinase
VSFEDKIGSRVGLYGRVSIDLREGRSVDSQLDVGRRWAATSQHRIVGEYRDDGISAYDTRRHRPDWQRAMDDISAGRIDILWVWEVSRASRDREVWAALFKACARTGTLISVNGKSHDVRRADDGFLLDLGVAIAVRESAMISERVKRATDAAAADGRPWGSIPYGYQRVYDTLTGSPVRQIPDPTTGPIVQEIVRRVLAGEGLHAIAIDLNRRGVPTPQMVRDQRLNRSGVQRGGWSNPKLRKMLGTPTISGWRVHRGQRLKLADWEPLVSHADHAQVLAIINNPERRTQRGTAPKYLLSGIATCGAVLDGGEVCGAWLRHFHNRGISSYGCNGRNGTNTRHVSRRMAPLDALVVVHVVTRLTDPGLLQAINRRRGQANDEAQRAADDIERLRTEITTMENEAQTRVRARTGSASSVLLILDGLHEQLAEALARAAAASSVPAVVVEEAGPHAAERWDGLGIARQRELVRALVTVTVRRSTRPRGTHGFDDTSVDVVDR